MEPNVKYHIESNNLALELTFLRYVKATNLFAFASLALFGPTQCGIRILRNESVQLGNNIIFLNRDVGVNIAFS